MGGNGIRRRFRHGMVTANEMKWNNQQYCTSATNPATAIAEVDDKRP